MFFGILNVVMRVTLADRRARAGVGAYTPRGGISWAHLSSFLLTDAQDARRSTVSLTTADRTLHDQVFKTAMEHERR